MIGGIIVILVSTLLAFFIIERLRRRYPFVEAPLLKKLFFYHLALALVYYLYVTFNPSDSKFYYFKVDTNYRGFEWADYYGTSTIFIEFIGYPLVKFLGFSYEAVMAFFSFFGYLGFVYFYIVFRENIKFRHQVFGYDLLKIILFLPNLHFWSASFGKGSISFFAIGLFFFGLSRITSRIVPLLLGAIIIYHVRPHILLVILISSGIGFIFSTKGVSLAWRMLFITIAVIGFFFIYRDVLTLVGIDEGEFVSQGLDLTHRATELTKATSGVDITNYSLPLQLFTFLFRPLFFDAPGALGLIVSFENLFYLYLTFQILNMRAVKFIFTGGFMIKTAMLSFITVSIALAQVAGNLGLAIRQKSQVMILFLFVIISFLDHQKQEAFLLAQRRRRLRQNAQLQNGNGATTGQPGEADGPTPS
jgi:hypothetical protein